MRNVRLTSAAVLAFAVVIAACAPAGPAAKSPSSGQPKRGGTLILARSGEVTNLDPHKVPAFTSARVFELVYSYLMRLDENLGVQPDLAESAPSVSSDGKQVTVKLRKGVKFHNGDPLTSADVKYTFDRIIDPKTAAVARSFFTDVNTITAPDDSTVVFDLKNPNAALIAYMAIVTDAKVARTLRNESGVTLSAKPSLSYNLLFLNTKRKPLDNVKVRQAIAYAIDRKAVIDAVAFGEGEITGPVAPALTNYALPTSQYPLYTRDLTKAKQLLQEANVGPVQFTILTATTEPAYGKDEAQLVQAQLAEAGITVKIETTELTQYVDRWLKADFDMATGLNGGGPDPDFYVFRYFTDDGNLNFVTSYKNPTSSDAIKAARASTDVAKRKDLYATAQKELVNGVPFIWLFVGRDYNATLPTTKGFTH